MTKKIVSNDSHEICDDQIRRKDSVGNFPQMISDRQEKIRRLKFPMTIFLTDFCPSKISIYRRILAIRNKFFFVVLVKKDSCFLLSFVLVYYGCACASILI